MGLPKPSHINAEVKGDTLARREAHLLGEAGGRCVVGRPSDPIILRNSQRSTKGLPEITSSGAEAGEQHGEIHLVAPRRRERVWSKSVPGEPASQPCQPCPPCAWIFGQTSEAGQNDQLGMGAHGFVPDGGSTLEDGLRNATERVARGGHQEASCPPLHPFLGTPSRRAFGPLLT